MINPLDALSALTQMQASAPGTGAAALPTGTTGPIGEGFNLSPLTQGAQTTQASAPLAIGSSGGPATWGHMVQQMVLDVNSKQQTAAQQVADVLKGGPTPVHEAMISSEEASLSFQFLAEMRNKVVDAYQQVMQMQV